MNEMKCVAHILHRIGRRAGDDRGAVAVSFILVFPIFLWIVAIIVQYALLVNARTLVEQAAQAAARSAITALPDQRSDVIERAARLSLVPLSPKAGGGTEAEAQATADALRGCGVDIAESFAARYTYAMAATQVNWSSADYPHEEGREVRVTVRYRFHLTVPGAAGLLSRGTDTVAGVGGRFQELVGTARAQTSHGRAAWAHGSGWPR